MKKIILLAACLAVVPAGAEELKFVTALSQPVASFAHLESVNDKRPAEALFVNFCNTGVSAGSISAKGLVKMNELRLTGNSQVGSSSVMNYQIMEPTGFAIGEGGSVLGAKLLAEKADPRDVVVEAGVDLNDNASFMAADLASLKIGAHTTVVPSAYSNDYVMIWDDSYKANYEVSSAGVKALPGAAYNSFLLRYRMEEKDICGAGTPAASESTRTRNCADDPNYGAGYEGVINEKYSYFPDCEWKEVSNTCKSCADSSYRAAHKSECCPSAAQTDTVCWTCKQEYVLDKINQCSCTPCAMAAFPSDPAIEEKMCYHFGADPCHCIKNWYTSGGSTGNIGMGGINKKSCSISQWQSCETTCTKNGW